MLMRGLMQRELAYQAMLAQKQEAAAYMHDAIADSEKSGAPDVGASLSDSDQGFARMLKIWQHM